MKNVSILTAALMLASCDVKYDRVIFHPAGIMPATATPVPEISIDTHVTAGMMGGTVKSHKPYDIKTHYLDDTFTLASAEFTSMTVTYADGTADPGIAAIKLPIISQHKIHEMHNSTAGGAIVVTKSRIIQADFSGIINRDEPFTLQIEGKFTKDDGTIIPFKIMEKYDISRDIRKESWVDFVSGC